MQIKEHRMLIAPDLITEYPEATKSQVNAAIKYQEKFNLTLDNLKCINPECKNMKKWKTTKSGFGSCCSETCRLLMKDTIIQNMLSKLEQTNLLKYGVSNVNKLKQTKDKARETYFQKTGYINSSYNPSSIKLRRATCLLKYGIDHPMKSKIIKDKVKQKLKQPELWDDKEFWKKTFITSDNYFDLRKCMEYSGYRQPACHYQLKNLEIQTKLKRNASLQERMLIPYLESLEIIIETNVRNIIPNMELDIWLPEFALAIEWNGAYWHSWHSDASKCTSSKQFDKEFMMYRHQRKSIACIERGIRLLHLYEDLHLENWQEAIEDFILYEPESSEVENIYNLDTGCYPLDINLNKITEPESRIILKDRIIWGAGKIQ